MGVSLHAAFVPSCIQILGSIARLIDKAALAGYERGAGQSSLLGARLADDMLDFRYQVKSVVMHSADAIEAVRQGRFTPDVDPIEASVAELRAMVRQAEAALAAIDPAEMEAFVDRDMIFVWNGRDVSFSADQFLLSFSQPNFYFHAAAAYAILRAEGLPLAKRDYLGTLRIRRDA
ncbi:DUF1993 domain-containing protein [Sphingomonas abietis]|uniref:DUF1993 domain-containing protein n=1 Tax=Sphingomonas abietis TaxID=3012344 RepID=A0ABY7NK65_9SPHN|nr:DUF1993 domain-containing protein [Sphingomonas abietis]WBO21632.1 DUF1993 domain-containing protein [Sphingomonas abietis]